jgi:hypothetical protein
LNVTSCGASSATRPTKDAISDSSDILGGLSEGRSIDEFDVSTPVDDDAAADSVADTNNGGDSSPHSR